MRGDVEEARRRRREKGSIVKLRGKEGIQRSARRLILTTLSSKKFPWDKSYRLTWTTSGLGSAVGVRERAKRAQMMLVVGVNPLTVDSKR